MAIYSIKGSKVSIGPVMPIKSTPHVAGDFTGTFVEIKEPETLGTAADTFAEIAFDNITDGRTKVLKGAAKASPVELTFGADYADAGQIALRTAAAADADYGFKVELADKPSSGASPKNSIRWFIGKVMTISEVFDAVNNVHKLTVSVQPNSNIVAVAASAT